MKWDTKAGAIVDVAAGLPVLASTRVRDVVSADEISTIPSVWCRNSGHLPRMSVAQSAAIMSSSESSLNSFSLTC